jgi:PAS domain S-box-containing protein
VDEITDVRKAAWDPGNEFDGRRRTKRRREEAFEALISDLLARFPNVSDDQIDTEIENSIRRIAEFLGLDQGLLVQWGDDAARPLPSHSWTVPRGLPLPVSPGTEGVPWVHQQSVLGKIVMVSRVDDLPQEAEKDKEFFRASGRKALISLPLKIGGRVVGALVFASLRAETSWPDEVVRKLQLIVDFFASLLHQKKSRLQLEERLRFEELLLEVSARFANILPDQTDPEINRALKQVLDFFGVDRCALLKTSSDRKSWQIAYVAYAEGIPLVPEKTDLPMNLFPWAASQLLDRHEVVFFKTPDDLPPEADTDKQTYRAWGIKSATTIPILIGGPADYVLAINAVCRECSWPEDYIPRLRLLGEIFVNALERKRVDQALRESDERLSLAAESAAVGLWCLAMDSGHIWATGRTKEMFGFPPDSEMTLESFLNVVHPEDRERLRRTVEEAMESGRDNSVEYRVVRPYGDAHWILSRSRPYPSTPEEPARLMGASIDITDRKNVEDELKQSRERFRHVAENICDFIWEVDANGLYSYTNPSIEKILGYSADELIGKKYFYDLFAPDVRERLKAEAFQVFRAKQPFRALPNPNVSKDGKIVHLEASGIPVLDEAGNLMCYRGVDIDVTERKRAEEEIRKAYEEIKNLKDQLEAENIYLREEMNMDAEFANMIGQSDAMKYVFFRVQQVAPTDSTVLITGETGTGKGMVARAIHKASDRRDRPMVMVNCAALPAGLIESELFGREKGAFTGAHASQVGRFDLANRGTIFLDEIGDLPLELQAKLLRVIEDGEFEKLGSPLTVKVDVRIIASTNRDLKKEIQAGRFREDLFYRLNVFPITMPPLKQRKDDIPLLVLHFMKKHSTKMGKTITQIPPRIMQALENFPWPGNIRELENVIERAVILTRGNVLQLADPVGVAHTTPTNDSEEELSEVERAHILKILKETLWKIEGPNGAAEMVGLKPSTLRSRMKKLGIQKPRKA